MTGHWEEIYRTKREEELSWHQENPGASLQLILHVAGRTSRVLDVGGGTSSLGKELLETGVGHVAVLDISESALARSKERSGASAAQIEWIVGDVTKMPSLPAFDVLHDRAVFHFFTSAEDRQRYHALLRRTIPAGGHLIVGTFAPDGPQSCSGLPVERYDADKLQHEFKDDFLLMRHTREIHVTPWGSPQPFTFAVLKRIPLDQL